MSRTPVKNIWRILFWLNLAIILFFWWSNQGDYLRASFGLADVLIAVGALFGLLGAYFVLLQVFMMGRMPWLERAFGLDKLSYLHRRHGKIAITFIILHPLLLTIGNSLYYQRGVFSEFWITLTTLEHTILSFIAFILFLVVVGTSIQISRSKLKYETWYFVHLAVYVAIFLAFWHQIELGDDLESSDFFYFYWIFLYIAVFASQLFFRFLRPIVRYQRHHFIVDRVHRETSDALSIYITGKDMRRFKVQPGQFMIFRFLAPGMWWQAHAFSLSKMHNGKEIRITVKASGDFTSQEVPKIKPGMKVFIDGPYGIFTDYPNSKKKVLLIAGGIGITPIRSLAEDLVSKKKDVILLYGNRTKGATVFKDELLALEKQGLKTIHVISGEKDHAGEKGHIDAEKIKRLVPDLMERDVFVCGPDGMMTSVLEALTKLGVPAHSIFYEQFWLG